MKAGNGETTKVFDEVGANSRQIAITKADGTTELKGEIELWDSGSEKAVIHTSADGWVINANTSIFLYYDNDHADNANIDVTNTAAAEAVWDDEYKAVYHMVDATTSTIVDSTSNNNDGTKGAAGHPAEAIGKVGQAQDFAGDDDIIILPDNEPVWLPTGNLTIEAIIRSDVEELEQVIFDGNFGSSGIASNRLGFDFVKDDANKIRFRCVINDSEYGVLSAAIDPNVYYYVAGIRDGNTMYVRVDTTSESDSAEVGDIDYVGVYDDNKVNIGRYTRFEDVSRSSWSDIIDEIRLSDIARPSHWLLGTKNTLWDTLFTYGSEETEAAEVEVNSIFFGCNF